MPEAVYETIRKRLEVKAGDVLMSCSGSLGRTSLVETKARFAMVRSVALLRPVLTEMGQFLSFGIMSPLLQAQIDSRKTQTAQANIFQGKIKTLVFPMPGMQEQKRICEIVADALKRGGDQKETVIATLTSVNQLDQRILAKAFRGELVPQDPNDEPASVLLERIREEKTRKATEQRENKGYFPILIKSKAERHPLKTTC